jgi:hypothetical protein
MSGKSECDNHICQGCDYYQQNHPDAMPHNFCKYCRHNYACRFTTVKKYGTETTKKDA